MGGIGYALNDDLHVVYTRSSADAGQYASSYGAVPIGQGREQLAQRPGPPLGRHRELSRHPLG